MTKKSTQSATRCARRPPPNPRTPRDRTRLFMPARISDEIRARIRELLMAGQYAIDVIATLKQEGVTVSRTVVDKEAYALHVAGKLELKRKPRIGGPHGPHKKGAGRPKLPDGQVGKQWSPNRDKVLSLHAEGLSVRDIAIRVGITRQGVERILKARPASSPSEN